MNSEIETIGKFASALNIDTIKEVKYLCKGFAGYCICGQPIKHGYKFINQRNKLTCLVGKECLQYVADYLGWKKNG